MSYTISMSADVSFQLDPKGGQDVLTQMAMPVVKQAAEAIAARANGMASSMSSDPPEITVSTKFGTIKRGVRAIATIKADGGGDTHKGYIGTTALAKSKDAGRV